jgi:hypothetical protein
LSTVFSFLETVKSLKVLVSAAVDLNQPLCPKITYFEGSEIVRHRSPFVSKPLLGFLAIPAGRSMSCETYRILIKMKSEVEVDVKISQPNNTSFDPASPTSQILRYKCLSICESRPIRRDRKTECSA